MIENLSLLMGIKLENIKVFLKSLSNEIGTIKAIYKLLKTIASNIICIYGFTSILKDEAGYNMPDILMQNQWLITVAVSIIVSFINNRERTSYEAKLQESDFKINVQINNLFSVDANSYIIPTNTFFRTVMEGEYISPQSVQGAFQLRYFNKKREELDNLIGESLKQQGLSGENASDCFGAVKRFPVGTVAKVDHNGKHYFFVAITDVNKYGKPVNQKFANIEKAISGLFATINKLGHCDELAMPLIGTGRAAIQDATIERVVEYIIDRFINTNDKIAKKLTICISPKAYLEGYADLNKIGKYVVYRCEFR